MGSAIGLDIELEAIYSFYRAIINKAELEFKNIQMRSDAGEFKHYDDEANAYCYPIMWNEIAYRATLSELNSLVEFELMQLALRPFSDNCCKRSRYIFDLRMNEIIGLIEKHYKLKIDEVECYKNVKTIRDKVNSFKHRKGYPHPRRENKDSTFKKYEADVEEAMTSIENVRSFLLDLWLRTKEHRG